MSFFLVFSTEALGLNIMIMGLVMTAMRIFDVAQLARENDAMVIALTSAGTPLAREATLAITLDVPEDTDIYMPMVSRLAQLTVIDVLATGFTLRRGAKFRDNLKRVKEALKESRFDKQLLNLSDDR